MEKTINQDSREGKAEKSVGILADEIMANFDNGIDKRLTQSHIQNVKKYYFEEYRKKGIFVLILLLYLSAFYFFKEEITQKEVQYQLFAGFLLAISSLRFYYDILNLPSYFLSNLLGHLYINSDEYDEQDILVFLEKKIFKNRRVINYYFYLTFMSVGSISMLLSDYLHNPKFLIAIPLAATGFLFDFICIRKIK